MTPQIITAEADSISLQSPLLPWWSFTKTALAAAALRLVERGKLRLDDPVEGAPYTLRHLLQHTAGVPDYGWLHEYHQAVAANQDAWPREELLRVARASEPLFRPGSSWAYSNIGYLFVREIIEKETDATLGEALRALIFEPLGIKQAFVAETRDDMGRSAWGNTTDYDPRWVYHGLLIGPPSEAAGLLHRLLFSDFLSPELKEAMLTPRSVGGPFPGRPAIDPSYGLGVMIDPASPSGRVVGHTGQGPGSTSVVYSFLDLPTPRTLAAFVPDDHSDTQGLLERHLVEAIRGDTTRREGVDPTTDDHSK